MELQHNGLVQMSGGATFFLQDIKALSGLTSQVGADPSGRGGMMSVNYHIILSDSPIPLTVGMNITSDMNTQERQEATAKFEEEKRQLVGKWVKYREDGKI
jgi:hypothetical protein